MTAVEWLQEINNIQTLESLHGVNFGRKVGLAF
jgi:hypothetical protein